MRGSYVQARIMLCMSLCITIGSVPPSDDRKLATLDDLESAFAEIILKIKEILCKLKVDVVSLIEQLRTFSAVRDQHVPLLDEDVFTKVTTMEQLWQKLSNYWTMYNYDILKILLELVKCDKASEVFEKFLARIDPDTIEDMDLVLRHEVFRRKESMKPLLRIKIGAEKFTSNMKKKVEGKLRKKFNLEKYSIRFKGIKEGCIELLYQISVSTMSYLLRCKVTGHDLAAFSRLQITSLQLPGLAIVIPDQVKDLVRCTYNLIAMCVCGIPYSRKVW